MKKQFMKAVSALLAGSMLLLTGCSEAELAEAEQILNERIDERIDERIASGGYETKVEEHTHQVEEKTTPLYFGDAEDVNEFELAFMDGAEDIPYVSVDVFRDMYVMLLTGLGHPAADLTIEKDGETVTMTRESGYPMVIDFAEDTLTFMDYDAFLKEEEAQPLMDVITVTGFNDAGEPEYFSLNDTSYERYGDMVTLRPGEYGIDLISQDGEYYLPLQLVSDIIFSQYSCNTLYNGECVCLIGGGLLEPLEDQYYIEDAPNERSDALIDFNYKELCFAMDALYGLKEEHRITAFDLLFKETGLIVPMMSKDPQVAGQALADLMFIYFDDKHSGMTGRSYMMEEEATRNPGPTSLQSLDEKERYTKAREKFYPDCFVPYEEVGNTAFITFDDFIYADIDYYGGEKPEDYLMEDTVGLMLYAYDQVTREGSPIENVVLDLSNNGGGMADAAAFVLGTFLGDGSISMMNPLSGALVSENFKVDLNLDRKFDESDSLKDYNLFCLISDRSFSCGNLVPSVFKNSRRVTLIGQQSGGGACVVHHMTSADGCIFQISGMKHLAYMKNGSFYDIDQGAEPDFFITNPELLFDREYMTDYVNELMGK